MSNYDLNRHKRGDKIKWVFTGIAFFLVIITIVGMCMQIWGKGKVKPSEWFKQEETEQNSPDTENEDTELSTGGATITDGESNGMLLSATAIPLSAYEEYGVSTLSAENVYILSVTYTPEDTTFQETTYSIDFKNKSSTWATGKVVTDYATVTQSAEGSKDAVLTVLKPFSEQIIVTAANNRDTKIKAITTVDYVYSYISCVLESNEVRDWSFEIEFSDFKISEGTIYPEFTNAVTVNFSHTLSDEFCSLMSSKGYSLSDTCSITFDYNSDTNLIESGFGAPKDVILELGGANAKANESEFFESFCSSMTEIEEYCNLVKSGENIGLIKFEGVLFHRVLNGVNYGDIGSPIGEIIYFSDNSPFVISATSATSDTSSIIAG